MNFVALKMLFGDRAKYLGMIMGLTFASLLITQQGAIFVGLMTRTYGFITDTGLPDLWVMDPKVQFIDDIKPLQDTELYRVRGVEGIEWAVPLYKGLIKARLEDGTFQTCIVVGLDDATLIGGPPAVMAGQLADLRQRDAVIVDVVGASDKLAKPRRCPAGRLIRCRSAIHSRSMITARSWLAWRR
jgi:putative ABC transport system permease protein